VSGRGESLGECVNLKKFETFRGSRTEQLCSPVESIEMNESLM